MVGCCVAARLTPRDSRPAAAQQRLLLEEEASCVLLPPPPSQLPTMCVKGCVPPVSLRSPDVQLTPELQKEPWLHSGPAPMARSEPSVIQL